MRNLLRSTVLPAALLALAFCASHTAAAQAIPTADRPTEIAPFFTATSVSPDWGSERDTGYTAGLDYTRLARVGQPALEFRVTSVTGIRVDEFSYGGGLKLQSASFGIVRPYATMLAGIGSINIHPGGPTISKSTNFMYALGGGFDVKLRSTFKLKADFLQQTWSFKPDHLTPIAVSIGLSYTLPLGQQPVSQ